jgi:hypothetical protein
MAATSPGGKSSCRSTQWSTWSQLLGRQSSRGPTRWLPGMQRDFFKPLQVARSSNGLDFPWVAGPAAVYVVYHQGTAACRVASPNRGPKRGRPICVKPSLLSRHTGRSVVRWPRLPRAVGAAAGHSRPLGIVQLRPSSSRGSPRWRSLRVACPPRTKRDHLGSSGGRLSCGTQCVVDKHSGITVTDMVSLLE